MSKNEIKEGVSEYEEEKNSKKNDTDINSLLNRAKSDFVDDGLSKGKDFLDIEDSKFEEKAFNNFLSYLNGKNNYSILATELAGYSPEQRKAIEDQIRQEVLKNTIKNKKNSDTLINLISEEYEIKGGDNIEKKLKTLKSHELSNLLNSELKRKKFIEKNYSKNEYEVIDDTEKFLKEINIEGINIEKLEKGQKEAIQKFADTQNLNSTEFLHFLSVFDKDKKIAILKHFKVSINLFDLLKEGIIDEKTTKGLLEKSIQESYPNLDSSKIKEFINNSVSNDLLLKDINLSIKELENLGDKEIKNLLRNKEVLSNLSEKFSEKEIELAEGELNEKLNLDDKGNIHQNFINLIKTDHRNVGDKTRNTIENFKKGNYIKLKLDGKEYFYQVGELELGGDDIQSKIFKRKNLNSPFGNGLLNPRDAEDEYMSYEKLYKLFQETNKIKGADVEFINEKEFNKNGDLEFNDGLNNISSEEDLKNKLIENGNLDENLKDKSLTQLCFIDDKDEGKGNYLPFYRYFQASTDNFLVFEGSNQKMNYSDFFEEIKKGGKEKYKFQEINYSAENALEKAGLNDKLVLRKDKLLFKDDKKESGAKEIDFFINRSGKKGLKIENISNGSIEYSIGDLETDRKKSKISEKQKKGGVKSKTISVTHKFDAKNGFNHFNDFILHIEKEGFSPDLEGKILDKKIENDPLEKEGGFMKKLFTNSSVLELIQGGTMMVDAIKEHFEHGNKLRASKFAQKFGSILPDTISTKLRSKAEKETNDLINERIDMWKVMGSDVATKDIERNILLNKYAEDHEILAAMQYMVEKNGTLYAKELFKYRPDDDAPYEKHLWFRKLGGTKEEFLKEKANITKEDGKTASGRDDPELFSTEKLAMSALSKGAKSGRFPSKIHKDFWGKVETGHKKRMEKGVEETSMYYTAADKVDYTLTYLAKGEASRFIGAMEKTLGKDSDEYSMNVMPFVLGMSGASSTWHSGEIQELHRLDASTAYPTLEMMKSADGIKLYQDAIYTFLDKSGNTEALAELKAIKTLSPAEQIYGKDTNNLHKFFMKHSKLLTEFITLRDGFAATRRNEPEGKVLGDYYDRIKRKFNDEEFQLNKDSTLAGTYNDTGLMDANAKLDNLKIHTYTGEYTETNPSKRIFKAYFHRLNEIKNLKSVESNPQIGVTNEQRKQLFFNVFKAFEKKISGQLTGVYTRYENDNNKFYKTQVAGDLLKNNIMLTIHNGYEQNEDFYNQAYLAYMNDNKFEEYKQGLGLDSLSGTMGSISDKMNDIVEGNYEPEKIVYEDENNNLDNHFKSLKKKKDNGIGGDGGDASFLDSILDGDGGGD